MMDWSIGEEFRIISTKSSVSLHVNLDELDFQTKEKFYSSLNFKNETRHQEKLEITWVVGLVSFWNTTSILKRRGCSLMAPKIFQFSVLKSSLNDSYGHGSKMTRRFSNENIFNTHRSY